jgi:hypothetical protein
MRQLLCIAALTGALGWSPIMATQDPASFFVEIEPARSTFFSGDYFTIRVVSDRGELANFVDLEILSEERVVWSHPLIVSANARVVRKARPHFTASLAVTVDEKLPPGIYRARARKGETVSERSAPFTIEPWGKPDEGVQVALGAPSLIASGERLVVTLTLRNTSARPLHVPSDDAPDECAMGWLTFVLFRDNQTGIGLPDDRKNCGVQPIVLLEPGKVTTYRVDLGKFNMYGHQPRRPFSPAPGRIRLHVSVRGGYYAADADRPGLWKGKALSNVVSIDVK